MATSDAVTIRDETPGDYDAVAALITAAFRQHDEAALLADLREVSHPLISLVAERAGRVVAHVCFTPVRVVGRDIDPAPMGLGPLAVLPSEQRSGLGAALTREGIERCRGLGAPFVVVFGHSAYYPRFGFVPAAHHGLFYAGAPNPAAFMVRELVPGALRGVEGEVKYLPAFDVPR